MSNEYPRTSRSEGVRRLEWVRGCWRVWEEKSADLWVWRGGGELSAKLREAAGSRECWRFGRQQCRDTRFGCGSASSTAWCPKYCSCKRFSYHFLSGGGYRYDKDRQISAPEGKGLASAIDGDENITSLKTLPGLASAPIHLQPEKRYPQKSSELPAHARFPQCFHSLDGLWVVLLQIDLANTQSSMILTGWLGGNQIARHLNFCLMCSDNLARVGLYRMNGGLIREGTAFPQIITRF